MNTKPRYRFKGRQGGRYVWEALIPGDSRVDQITCNAAWFWSSRVVVT